MSASESTRLCITTGFTCIRWTDTERHTLPAHEDGVENPRGGDEAEGSHDEEAERLRVGQGDHEGELEEVHQLVERTLHAVDDASLRGNHLLQEQLRDGQVGYPHTWGRCSETPLSSQP